MRSSYGADVASRMHDFALHHAWSPPTNEKRRPGQVAANLGKHINVTAEYKTAEAAAQRALQFAARRAAALDRLADHCLQFGMGATAERLSRRAAAIRGTVL